MDWDPAVLAEQLAGRHAGMVFVADDLAAWLVFILAEGGRKKLTSLILGGEPERALRPAATAAVQRTAAELCPDDARRAEELAIMIGPLFKTALPGVPLGEQATVLEGLHVAIAGQLKVLDDPGLTATVKSLTGMRDVSATIVAKKLTDDLVREIVVRGSRGGPLEPLANQLNHDVTHLQGQEIKAMYGQLAADVKEALARLDATHAVPAMPMARPAHGSATDEGFSADETQLGHKIVNDEKAIPVQLILSDLRPALKVVAEALSGSYEVVAIATISGLDQFPYPSGRVTSIESWVAVFDAALEGPLESAQILMRNIFRRLEYESKGMLEAAMSEVGLLCLSRITRATYPRLGDQTEALLAACSPSEMNETVQRLRLTTGSVRQLLLRPLITEPDLMLGIEPDLMLPASGIDPKRRRMELAHRAKNVVNATDRLLNLLNATATKFPKPGAVSEAGSDRWHSPVDDPAADRLNRRLLDARGKVVRSGTQLTSGLGHGPRIPAVLTMPDLTRVLHLLGNDVQGPGEIYSIVILTGLQDARYLIGPAHSIDRWMAVFKEALKEPPETLALLVDNIRDSLRLRGLRELEVTLRKVGRSCLSRITQQGRPELADQAEGLTAARSPSEMNEAAHPLRLTTLRVRQLLLHPLLGGTCLPLNPSIPHPEQRRMELADLAVDIITAIDYLLSLLEDPAVMPPHLVLDREANVDQWNSPARDEAMYQINEQQIDARETAVRLANRLFRSLRNDVETND